MNLGTADDREASFDTFIKDQPLTRLPAPYHLMTHQECRIWLTHEVLVTAKETKIAKAAIKRVQWGCPSWRPVWWPSDIWEWELVTTLSRNTKGKIGVLREAVKRRVV